METEIRTAEQQAAKKGRHRKKHLYNSILQMMEFYFSDANLSKDRFLSNLIETSPYVDLSVFLKFNKIRKLTQSVDDIKKALSSSDLLELDEDKLKVRRKTPVKLKDNVDDCTIYVEHIKSDATHEWLNSIFSEFGKVAYVSLPKYKHNQMNKGFAFIEFDKENEAHEALAFFESINSKIPSRVVPEGLCSIKTFEKDQKDQEPSSKYKEEAVEKIKNQPSNKEVDANIIHEKEKEADTLSEKVSDQENTDDREKNVIHTDTTQNNTVKEETENEVKKRKHSSDENERKEKRLKVKEEDPKHTVEQKKIARKENKKKSLFKELGFQVLSKREWKALRNKYLNMQREKMKQVKQHLHRTKFSQKIQDVQENNPEPIKDKTGSGAGIEFIPGTIVKIQLKESCEEVKKTKNEIKALSDRIKFVDARVGFDIVYVRFADAQSAKSFCEQNSFEDSVILADEEEKEYWKQIEETRMKKFSRKQKPLRGRNKLLKKAEKLLNKHIIFDDAD